jgi:3-deoxy-7-phosphoheptulonate synthase
MEGRKGGDELIIIAGQCSIDEHFIETSFECANLGATHIRAGLFKPRSSPHRFSGWGNESEERLRQGLDDIRYVKELTGCKIVAEAMNPKQIELLYDNVDVFQVGSRNQQDTELLKEFGKQDKPVLLKRGFATLIEEFIMAIDFLGNAEVWLCERGIRTFENYTRNTFDISAIPILKQRTNCKVIADPSHGTGRRELVIPVAKAAIAAGADGLMIEVHREPEKALTDGEQSLAVGEFAEFMQEVEKWESLKKQEKS